jgi:hypothetical protein
MKKKLPVFKVGGRWMAFSDVLDRWMKEKLNNNLGGNSK